MHRILTSGLLLCSLALAFGQQAPSPSGAPSQAELDQAVDAGIQFVSAQAASQIQGAKDLQAAIASGNLTEARLVYGRERHVYEQMELLAYAFPDIDSDLDARPYSFTEGEFSGESPVEAKSGSIFMGIHKIEALLFRDSNVSAAEPYAQRLVQSSQELQAALQNRTLFDATGQYAALIDEATEVAGKKIASEEETYSNLSNLIFFNNFLGLQGVYAPFGSLLERVNPLIAQRVNDAIAVALQSVSAYAPYIDGEVSVIPYSYVTVEQRAPIQSAGYELASVLREAGGILGLDLSEEEEEEEECTPTVQAAQIPASGPQIQGGLNYFRALLPAQLQHAQALTAAIRSQDLAAAKDAYLRMRPVYEQVEVLANSFPDIDSDIDAREYAFPYGERDSSFKGNHHIEALLFRDGNTGPAALALAQGLEASFQQLGDVFATSGNDDEVFNAQNNFGGVIALATEVIAKKVSSEEEKYSDRSWLIFYNNYKGLYSQALPFYNEDTASLRAELEEAVQATVACFNITTEDDILDLNVGTNGAAFADRLAAADYKLYSQADISQKECLIQNGEQVRQVLMETGAALSLFDDCSDFYMAGSAAPAPAPSADVSAASAEEGDSD